MIKIIRATQEKRTRDKKRKRFILKVDDSRMGGRLDYFHLTDKEANQMRLVLNGRRLK